tara:strand:- start:403 stop:576 length:174 start_codon:yes stop_codon:yes gene_type:complete
MKITDITTTLLSHYHPKPIQDGTTISPTLTTVGRSPFPDRPGLGLELNLETIEKLSV